MLTIEYNPDFLDTIHKIKDKSFKTKIKKQVKKIIDNPVIGKPMRHTRRGTREVYVKPYRLAYAYNKSQKKIIFLEIYHKDKQR